MLKTHYLKELSLAQTCRTGSQGNDVKKIQEWLELWRHARPDWALTKVDLDGVFGPQTAFAVKEFQAKSGMPATGAVDVKTFARLCGPMAGAWLRPGAGTAGPAAQPAAGPRLRQGAVLDGHAAQPAAKFKGLIIPYARRHLAAQARELGSNNGPWVRAYMDGNEGKDFPWCAGFVQTIFDLACSACGFKFTEMITRTFSCDGLGLYALSHDRLIPHKQISRRMAEISPGDIFLVKHPKNKLDWVHTGLIESKGKGFLITIEGNTNDEGSREGYEVCRRRRDLGTEKLDVMKV
ncbi:peptidoglycan-binding protein [candidate division TA06 bacterium]|nr:peptidoglycan-binding protein [candidate division TA06 bacterium]